MKEKLLLCIFLILSLVLSRPLLAQGLVEQDSIPTTWELLKYDGSSALGGIKRTYTAPLKWQKDDFITAGAVVAGTAFLYIFDEETSDYFIDQKEDVPGVVRDFGWYFGSPQNNYGITGAVYLTGLFTKNEKIRKTGVLMISAATASGIIQSISKTVVGRARPGAGEGKGSFKPFSNEGDFHSFPSGHTILAFTTLYALSKQFENPFLRAGLIGVGLISPVSRLWDGAHWLTDVGLSLAISVVVVDTIDKYLSFERDYGYEKKKPISWKMNVGLGRIGITGTF
ncbi:phosphatase PAP2 family protein [Christiangramia sabulilitoris]|uniref:Phosphatase PAP2 family protein n=1 Tax=Christiangramia sabulilitoris TaxID=2583991 RepID=A0A550I910_9FLAO|nr:phosphatase PAP2 family protein [Christiangramia sabulilitoris]TRO67461.1 phosphatase PAP2 family protein [Christiangramia sabulilitoris]